MPKALTKCPSCGERVTPYAAGCAICGTDLEPARRRLAERRSPANLTRPAAFSSIGYGESGDFLFAAAMILVALFAPPIGLILSSYMAYRFDRDSRPAMRNVAIACAGAAATGLIFFPLGLYLLF